MNILLAILTFVLLIVTNVSSQDISGNWQGILYQQNGPYTTYFSSSFHFYQSGERINGSSLSILPNTNSYVTHNLLGSVNNNEFTFGTHIVSQVPLANGSWCSPNVTLTYDSISETLKGNWSDASCATGAIELSRLKTISKTNYCEEETIELNVIGQNVKWYSDSSSKNLVGYGNFFSPNLTSTTTYFLTQTLRNIESPPIGMTIIIRPKSFLTIDVTLCAGQTYGGYSKNGIYIDTFSTSAGCDSIRMLNLTVNSTKSSTINESICEGQTYSGHSTSGVYLDSLISTEGCDSIRTLYLTVNKKPNPELGANMELCNGDSLIISPGDFSSYLWQDASTLRHLIVKRPGLYSVLVKNSCGSAIDEVKISEKFCNTYFPSAFAPSNLGKNNLFKMIKPPSDLKSFYLAIYNRFGQKVFETKDYALGWNGLFHGQLQPSGIYVWFCKFEKYEAMQTVKGTVMLIR